MPDKAPTMHFLADRVLNTPLLIHPAKLETILSVLGGRIGLDVPALKSDFAQADAPEQSKTMAASSAQHAGGQPITLAIISIHGTLVHRSGGMSGWSGLRSYQSIRKDFRTALADSSIDGIVFDAASGGGEGAGCFDLADEIYEARNSKPIYGIANESAYSACYALLSACTEIYLTRTAGVGSIGVRAVHVDRSARNEEEGLKFTAVFAGARKNDFSPDEPLSDTAHQILQESINSMNDIFVSTVARNRKMKESAVRKTEAGFFEGEDAVAAGLADAVLSFDQAITRIAENISTGGNFMPSNKSTGLQHQLEALLKGSSDDENATAMAAMGFVPASAQIDEDAVRIEAAKGGHKKALDYAGEIIGLCQLGGQLEMAGDLIAKETSVDDARKQVVDAKAAADTKNINSTVAANSAASVSPLVADAQARADKGA